MYDFKAMSVFTTVVKLGSMQAAADKLAMTPSAITQSIQKLESHLQIKLLNRTTRKLSLTEAGEAFFQHTEQMLQNAEKAVKSVEMLRSRPVGELNIACVTGLLDSLLMKAFKQILAQHPDFHLNFFFEDRIVDMVEQRIDIALRAGQGTLQDNMIARHMFDEQWATVAHRDYLQHRPQPQTLNELAELDWINFGQARNPFLTFQRGEVRQEIAPHYRVNCNSLYASRQFTFSGFGVSIQPFDDVRTWLESGELVALLPEWKLPPIPIYLVTLQRIQSEKVRIACDLIGDYFAALKA